jgi:hypothetical protein
MAEPFDLARAIAVATTPNWSTVATVGPYAEVTVESILEACQKLKAVTQPKPSALLSCLVAAVKDAPWDSLLRRIYSDALEESGHDAEAGLQRMVTEFIDRYKGSDRVVVLPPFSARLSASFVMNPS